MIHFEDSYSQLPERFFRAIQPATFPSPQLLKFNFKLASHLGIETKNSTENELASIFSGQMILEKSSPIAMAYAGHQFGYFVPQLGDGRAVLLGEIIKNNKRYDIQLKGAGQTPFSRGGDGRSPLGPVIREYIVSEAMHNLHVPTTRALAAVATGETVFREFPLAGAVLTRVASSHLRIGTFQYFSCRKDHDAIRILLDYAIDRHYPDLKDKKELLFLQRVASAQASLVAQWMSYGFIHGVMNTDNCSISGETIDFGPCAFMDEFHSDKIFSSIDRGGRYAYSNQISIAQWNILRLADCLLPLIYTDQKKAVEKVEESLHNLNELFLKNYRERMGAKLGLIAITSEDDSLIKEFLNYLQTEELDFTLSFRNLSEYLAENKNTDFYPQSIQFKNFIEKLKKRLENQNEETQTIKARMNTVNPLYVPRNHLVERAIQGAYKGDFQTFHDLIAVLENPFEVNEKLDTYRTPPLPKERVTTTYCGT